MKRLLITLFAICLSTFANAQAVVPGNTFTGPSAGKPPAPSIGGENAWYLDSNNGNLWGPKSAGQWPSSPIYSGIAGSSLAPETASGVFNANSSTLLHWRKVVAAVGHGSGRGKLLVIGDSTSIAAGSGSGGVTALDSALPNGWVPALAPILTARGITTSFNGFFGDQGTTGSSQSYPAYDTRVTGSWNYGANNYIGGELFSDGGDGATLAFTPINSFNEFIFWGTESSGLGSLTFNVDGGSTLATIDQSTGSGYGGCTNGFCYAVVGGITAGTHTINIVPDDSGATVYVGGITPDLGTTSAIDIIQSAVYGATDANFVGGTFGWQSTKAFDIINPDLTIINLTINPSNNNGPSYLPTWTTNIQTIITAAKASGDCLLMVGPPSNTANATNGTLAAYVTNLRQLAVTNNCAMIDLKQRWTSYAYTNPQLPYFDNLHPEALGYQDIARAVAEVLSNP